jgi:hypothetical protein
MGKTRTFSLAALALLALAAAAMPALAQQPIPTAAIQGTVQDMDGDPVVGARVVYRLADEEGVFISRPTDATGRYTLDLPAGRQVRPVAVVVADGTRVDLGDVAPAQAVEGMTQQISIDRPKTWNPSAVVQNFPGSDRLFHSLVEDTAVAERFRIETQFVREEGETFDRGLMNVIGSASFKRIPNVEFGAKLGLVGVNTVGGSEGDGVGDADLWAKYLMGATKDSRHELAFGAVVSLPTGSDSSGTGFDSTMSKLFVAARREFEFGVMTGNLTLAMNGDGRFFGTPLSGETALGANFGVIVPWTFRLAFIGEVGYETERFKGWDDEASLLGGVNVLLKEGSFRGALAFGLSDGSPDVEVIVGYAFPF